MHLNILLIGLWRQWREHLLPCIELREKWIIKNIYVYDIDINWIKEISNNFWLIQLNSLNNLSNLEIKLAIITVPNINHFEVSKIVIESNINILIEKPLYLSINEYKNIENEIVKRNLLLLSCQQRVYNWFYKLIEENIKKLWNIKFINYTFTLNDKNESWYYNKEQWWWVLMWLSWHCLYFFNYFFWTNNKTIYWKILNWKNRLFSYDSDDINILDLKYDNWMIWHIYTSSVFFLKREIIEIIWENWIFYIDREKNILNLHWNEVINNNNFKSWYSEQILNFINLLNNKKNIIDNVWIKTLYDTLNINTK